MKLDLLRKQGGFDMYDVAIIGAGVVGSAIAILLLYNASWILYHDGI